MKKAMAEVRRGHHHEGCQRPRSDGKVKRDHNEGCRRPKSDAYRTQIEDKSDSTRSFKGQRAKAMPVEGSPSDSEACQRSGK
ncbi:hypothetical protein Acr_29g0000030 [Actinidia rufa]|uniref:Uncharacterized protein n=1 Tax=Actinidia rufa TaxID=165716 RepID=A0A7J0HCY2_9ERIC|nr:hypothetical protein Acr_29g0000030 [Actinidia rufa]